MDEQRLADIERRLNDDPDLSEADENWIGKVDVRELIAEVRRLGEYEFMYKGLEK